jgi:metal-sulfur cluster biosynthetic enzyme
MTVENQTAEETPAELPAYKSALLEDLEEAMRDVVDPELGVNVVDLGLVYGVDQEDDGQKVRLDMTLTTVACPLTDMIEGATNAALVGLDDIQEVEINWVWSPPWGPERLTEDGKVALRAMGFAI